MLTESRPRVAPVALLLFGSGLCSLVYQIVWLRELRNVFGSSTPATAAVLGIFMGGLGLGGLLLGRRADRHRNPLLLYARLEGGIAAAALLTLPLVRLVELAYYASGGSPALGMTGATLLRLLLAASMLGVPTFLMGGTLPAAVRAVLRPGDVRRRAVATLYGVNTLGAVAGVVGANFFALEILGNRRTLLIGVLLNLLVAITARARSRVAGETAVDGAEAPTPSGWPETPSGGAAGVFTWAAAAVAGFSFLLLELVWYRMLAPILGGSTFTFGLILATALLGIGLGGLLYALSAGDQPASLPLFAATCGLEALAIVVPFALGDRLAVLAALLRPLETLGFTGNLIGWSLVCGAVVLPAAIVSGVQFPLLISLAGAGRDNAGHDVGRVYAFNTLGAIAGSLAGGFGLMPLLTAPGCWKLAAWLMVVLCAASALLAFRARRPGWSGPVFAASAALLLLSARGPTAVWRHSPIGAGRIDLTHKTTNEVRDWMAHVSSGPVWETEGVESSIALDGLDGYAFIVNGKSDGNAVGDAPTQVMGGLLGALLHPGPKRSLVVGLGTGSTAGWLGKVPGMERVDVVEIEPEIREVAARCAAANQDVLGQPNVRIVYGDARELLLVTRDRYDLVFSEPSNPFRAGIASLFTEEFYGAVARRLTEGGVFVQWVQAYEIDARTVETIMRTLQGAFGHVQVWQTIDKDMVLVASRAARPVDADELRRRIAGEPYRAALRIAWRVDSVEGLLAHLVADDTFTRHVATYTASPVNTDDRNAVEFGLARSVGRGRGDVVAEIRAAAARLGMRDRSFRGAFDPELVRRHRTTSPLIAGTDVLEDPRIASVVSAHRDGRYAEAGRRFRELGLTPASHAETLIAAESFARTGDDACLPLLGPLREYDAVEGHLVAATYLDAKGRPDDATRALAAGFRLCRSWPWADTGLLFRAVGLANELVTGAASAAAVEALAEAVDEPFVLHRLGEVRRLLVLNVARRLEKGCGPRVMKALALQEPHVRMRADLLDIRAACYAENGHPLAALAARERDEFREGEPQVLGSDLPAPRPR